MTVGVGISAVATNFGQIFRPSMKKIIDILSILLPVLIILLGITKLFLKKTRAVNGLTIFFAFILLLGGLIRFYVFPDRSGGSSGPKPIPLSVSKHSEAFNQSMETVLTHYFALTNAFGTNDSTAVNRTAVELRQALDSLKVDELQVDSIIYQTALQPYENTKAEVTAIAADPSFDEKRSSLNIFSNELFSLISIVHYDLSKIFWFECESAFGENKPGNWLSKAEESENPYGRKDCRELKTTINFVAIDTTKKTN
jgi:hypothetical protein